MTNLKPTVFLLKLKCFLTFHCFVIKSWLKLVKNVSKWIVSLRPAIDSANLFPAVTGCRKEICMIPPSTRTVLTGIPPKPLSAPSEGKAVPAERRPWLSLAAIAAACDNGSEWQLVHSACPLMVWISAHSWWTGWESNHVWPALRALVRDSNSWELISALRFSDLQDGW